MYVKVGQCDICKIRLEPRLKNGIEVKLNDLWNEWNDHYEFCESCFVYINVALHNKVVEMKVENDINMINKKEVDTYVEKSRLDMKERI